MNLVFDLDDTLLDTYPVMIEALNSEFGLDHDANTLYTYDMAAMYKTTQDVVREVIVKHNVLERTSWLSDKELFAHAVRLWHEDGHKIVFCTARNWHPRAMEVTLENLAAVNVPYTIVLTHPDDNKQTLLDTHGVRADVFVDDTHRHVVAANLAGATSYLFRRRWNYVQVWGNSVVDQAQLIQAVEQSIYTRQNS